MRKSILTILVILLASLALQAQVAVVVNKSVAATSLDAAQLKDIFTLKTTKWSDGSTIAVFVLKGNDAAQDKFYGYIGENSIGLKKVWMKAQLTGEAKAPKALGSDAEVISKVASTPGAIGFVSAGSVSDAVKVVATIQ